MLLRQLAADGKAHGGRGIKLLYLQDPDFTLYQGNVMEEIKSIPDATIDCVVTSPPYWGLRDYGVPPQPWGVREDCDHLWVTHHRRGMTGGTGEKSPLQRVESRKTVMFDNSEFKHCRVCGGWMVPLGLEPTPELFVEHLADIFNQVQRVLKDTGNVFVNLGDSYHEKNLVGVPWLFAFEMKKRGWVLRRDNIWSKPNPMPESCTDRTTTAHEYIFHFTKRASGYYYNADAIREPHTSEVIQDWTPVRGVYGDGVKGTKGPAGWHEMGRNKRSVWEIPVQPYEEAHFATYPQKLVETCILSGTQMGAVVLDPFMGSGTTAFVARRLGRRSVGIELNPEYCKLITKRTQQLGLEFDARQEAPHSEAGAA